MTSFPLLRSARPVPVELRRNFVNLYLDIIWYGVLSGSTIAFLAVYAARLGATPLQLGLLTAGPAVVNLMVTMPVGRWLETRPIGPAVFWASVLHRCFYLLFILLPWFLAPRVELWAIIGITLVMSVPGTALAVGFNALFAEAVPPEWRGHVVGVRNALLAVAFIATSLVCGFILNHLPFPAGYQVVFAIGFVGAAMSSLHLALIRPAGGTSMSLGIRTFIGDLASPGRMRAGADAARLDIGLRAFVRTGGHNLLRVDLIRGPFGALIGVLFAFHFAQFLAIPLFPLVWVNKLGFSDGVIAWGQASFYVAVFLGGLLFARISDFLGYRRVIAIGIGFLSSYPAITAIMREPWTLMVVSLLGGFGWIMVSGGIGNYLLEIAPVNDRPAHLAWYNLALNGGILLGSLVGPALASVVGVTVALLIGGVARLVTAVLVWRFG